MKRTFLLLLLLFGSSVVETQQPGGILREFYVATVEIGWDYIHQEAADSASSQRGKFEALPQKFIKAVYREYTDSTFTVPKPREAWAGIQGPVIVAKGGDRVVVHFKNLASQPYSISPVGITYWKQSEGAGYDDSTAGQEKGDDAVLPGGYFEYIWDISYKDGPTPSDPDCLTYSYSSQVDTVRDMNSGLIGALLICKSSSFTTKGQRRQRAFVLLFAVFDESKSWYGEVKERLSREKFNDSNKRKEYHTINGYINSTLPGLTVCQGRDPVFWHLIGIGTAPEIHSIRFQDYTVEVMNHRKVTVEVTPMTFVTAEMKPTTLGQFLISCQIHAHLDDGMNALFTVEKCPEPSLGLREVKHEENNKGSDYDDYDDQFNTVYIQPKKPQFQARASRGQESQIWTHFIAAEEITWNYASYVNPTDSVLQSRYLPAGPHHLGYKYKKVVYVEYTDSSFTHKKNPNNTLLGPLIKGKINDQIHIIFRNLASRPFNIFPNGLTQISPLQKTTNKIDLRSVGVPPNGTFGYTWRLTPNDGPLEGDPQCLTHLYQSTVSPERDLASGLVGTLLICKYNAIDSRGRLLGPDEKLNLIFAVFDENRSWYFKENMQRSVQKSTDPTGSEFYESNVIYSINGFMFGGRRFVMCQTDVPFWHVANVGTQSDFLSVYFTGNLFQSQGIYQSVLTLFPMTAITVPMETELIGEWEISAFDSKLMSRGMSIRYSVRACHTGYFPLVDRNVYEDISDYYDDIILQARGTRPQNGTVLVRVCKKPIIDAPDGQNVTDNAEDTKAKCQLRRVSVTLLEKGKSPKEEDIPEDILENMDGGRNFTASLNEIEKEGIGGERLKRDVNGNWTEEGRSLEDETTGDFENVTATDVDIKTEENRQMDDNRNSTTGEFEERNVSLDHEALTTNQTANSKSSEDLDYDSYSSQEIFTDEKFNLEFNFTDSNTTDVFLSAEYDYDNYEINTPDEFGPDFLDPRSGETRPRHYYIAAEEITWDYGIKIPHQLIQPKEIRRGMRKFLPEYKKVVFRAYKDQNFLHLATRGEPQQHLGIMGPLIRTEVNDFLTVTFKNNAKRPFSFHLHGVYDLRQEAGSGAGSSSIPLGIPGEPVLPGETRIFNWKVSRTQGPTDSEFDCKTGAYYSTVDKESDLHSGLIGPLVICKPGTLQAHINQQLGIQDFALLFHTFDETKSWYMEENLQQYCTPPCQANAEDPWYQTSNKFAAINGYVAETLPGLVVAKNQLLRWHLLNVGGDREYHAVHFHGLPFTVHTKQEHRMGIFNLFPGVFGTVEMQPPTVGTWLVECTIGDYQLAGMRAKLLVYDPQCILPLGMKSGRIDDSQITASDQIDNWAPSLARLDQSGFINAWMGKNTKSWLQVDLQRPTLLHGVQTQGVRSKLRNHFISLFTVSYSLDQQNWKPYRGNTSSDAMVFRGNLDSSKVKDNRFFTPFVARYIRIHPFRFGLKPALRLELLGCDLNSCSMPLGLQKNLPDASFIASSFHSSLLRSWKANLARLHNTGSINAWRPQNNNPHEWLQVDLGKVKRVTGVITQGAYSLLTQMMVTEFSVTFSQDKHSWSSVLEESSQREKIFSGNNDPDEEVLNVFDPPLFARFVRIHPRGWINDIALRLELLGCDTQPGL